METTTLKSTENAIFLGRQPIFDRREKVFGYELLYRSNGTVNAFDGGTATGHRAR